jgi:hypothetical protein
MINCQCQRCSTKLTVEEPLKGPLPKYCEQCRIEIKRESAREYNRGVRKNTSACEECGITIDKTNAPARRFCCSCAKSIAKRKRKEYSDKHRLKKGVKVGVGSGNNQASGEAHYGYKSGIGLYKRIVKERGDTNCNRCGIDIDFSQHYKWVVHHIDHNRKNNTSENLELLCKKCHQHEHDCFGHKRKNHDVEY